MHRKEKPRERGGEEDTPVGYGLHISLANQDANLKKINSCATSLSGTHCDYNLIFQDERQTDDVLLLIQSPHLMS